MSYDFYSTREVKRAARSYTCDECRSPIALGEPYRAWSGVFDGEFYNGHVHGDCQDWAAAVLYVTDEGRPFLCEADPQEDIDNWRKPPPEVAARLPKRWTDFISAHNLEADRGQ